MIRKFTYSALVLLALAVNSFGAAITNVTITGFFHDPTDDTPGVQAADPAVTPLVPPAAAGPVTTVSWGVPPGALGQSNYRFAAIDQPAVPNILGPIAVNPPAVTPYFTLGTFTHNNFVVDDPYLTSVLLDVILSFQVDGAASGPHSFTYLFNHTETPNVVETGLPLCPFATPVGNECTDRVVLSTSGLPQAFDFGGVHYILELALQKGGINLSEFLTAEGQSNDALLVGRFLASDSPVPEPGTAAAMGAALLAAGAFRFRRSRGGN